MKFLSFACLFILGGFWIHGIDSQCALDYGCLNGVCYKTCDEDKKCFTGIYDKINKCTSFKDCDPCADCVGECLPSILFS